MTTNKNAKSLACLPQAVALHIALKGYGCLKSGNLERTMRDANITQIYEGMNQVQRFVVAEQLIKEFLEKYGMTKDWYEFL